VASLIPVAAIPLDSSATPLEGKRAVRDSLIVTLGGQLERAFGTVTALMLRWWLDPSELGVYAGLRLYLDNTNRSSLGVGLGAVQEIPILRAQGRLDEARRIADIAHTTNTVTCVIYSFGLLIWAYFHARTSPPEWTWGLVAVAALALLKRYESFLIAVLRAYQEFELTTKLDIFESLVSIVAVGLGLWLAGFWGLLASVGVIITAKIAFLHACHPLRFDWAWDTSTVARLMRIGLPILANTAAFGAVLSLDRALILWRVPDPDRALGLYTIAIMGTSWSLDLAGRIVTVMYTYFQNTLGRTNDPAEVARQALRATEAQAPLLASGCAVAYLVGPVFLGALMPRFVEGLPALRPLLPGTLLLGLAWPARQMLITIGRPYTLALATLLGLVVATFTGAIGADRAGIVGVAWGMTLGYAAVAWLTGAAASVPILGWIPWWNHLARLSRTLVGFALATLFTAHVPLGNLARGPDFAARCLILIAWLLPTLWFWGRRHEWGGFVPLIQIPLITRFFAFLGRRDS
jgi:O-antigen/teichoic acid export membrane protein